MLIAVTIFAIFVCLLGRELMFVRERKLVIAQGVAHKLSLITVEGWRWMSWTGPPYPSNPAAQIPAWRGWIGDEAVACIVCNAESKYEMHRLFPEATVSTFEEFWDDEEPKPRK